jgi:hypothetical protein
MTIFASSNASRMGAGTIKRPLFGILKRGHRDVTARPAGGGEKYPIWDPPFLSGGQLAKSAAHNIGCTRRRIMTA